MYPDCDSYLFVLEKKTNTQEFCLTLRVILLAWQLIERLPSGDQLISLLKLVIAVFQPIYFVQL